MNCQGELSVFRPPRTKNILKGPIKTNMCGNEKKWGWFGSKMVLWLGNYMTVHGGTIPFFWKDISC